MGSFNKVILMGNLTRDPEVRFSNGGAAIVKFTLACNRRYKDKAEQWFDEPFIVCCWRNSAFDKIPIMACRKDSNRQTCRRRNMPQPRRQTRPHFADALHSSANRQWPVIEHAKYPVLQQCPALVSGLLCGFIQGEFGWLTCSLTILFKDVVAQGHGLSQFLPSRAG